MITTARKAADAAKKVLKRSITIKSVDGVNGYTICIGHTDRNDDRVYDAITTAIGHENLGFGKIEICAEMAGHGVSTVEVV